MVDVSILLLTKDGRRELEQLLPALFSQCAAPTFEVIAVDSGSSDGTLELLSAFPVRIEQISPRDFHHARTRNYAASLAQGKILVFLSQDAIPASDAWLTSLALNFEDPKVGAVYGRQVPKRGASVEREDALDAVYGEAKLVKDGSSGNSMGYRFYHFSDANAAIRRDVWDAERFPEQLKVFEDLGIAKRILDRGWKIVYEPKAMVFHSHRHTAMGLFKRYFDIGYTFKLLQIWDAPGTGRSMLVDARRLLGRKLGRLRARPMAAAAGRGIYEDAAKTAGLLLGKHESLLPVILKRRLSAFGLFG
jgi:rhamnosyltransferase